LVTRFTLAMMCTSIIRRLLSPACCVVGTRRGAASRRTGLEAVETRNRTPSKRTPARHASGAYRSSTWITSSEYWQAWHIHSFAAFKKASRVRMVREVS
jgi:hypothetical protein